MKTFKTTILSLIALASSSLHEFLTKNPPDAGIISLVNIHRCVLNLFIPDHTSLSDNDTLYAPNSAQFIHLTIDCVCN